MPTNTTDRTGQPYKTTSKTDRHKQPTGKAESKRLTGKDQVETKEKNRQWQKGNKEQNAYNPATDRRVVYTKYTLPRPTDDKAKQTDYKANI